MVSRWRTARERERETLRKDVVSEGVTSKQDFLPAIQFDSIKYLCPFADEVIGWK